MNNKLLEKLKQSQKDVKKNVAKNLHVDSSFLTLTDEEIALVLAYRAKALRISENIKQSSFSKQANLSSASTYSNFEQTGSISLKNFIKVLRSFGRLQELENLLRPSISQKIDTLDKVQKKRVR